MAKHTHDLTITQMVYNRLPFLTHTTKNETLISHYIWEICYELEPCFNVGKDDETKIADEQYYSVMQRMLIADIVSVYILIVAALQNTLGGLDENQNPVAPQSTFLKKAKAGSAEVEYEAFDIGKSSFFAIKPETLISQYKKSAVNRGLKLGCFFDITDDNTIVWINHKPAVKPFVVLNSCKA